MVNIVDKISNYKYKTTYDYREDSTTYIYKIYIDCQHIIGFSLNWNGGKKIHFDANLEIIKYKKWIPFLLDLCNPTDVKCEFYDSH